MSNAHRGFDFGKFFFGPHIQKRYTAVFWQGGHVDIKAMPMYMLKQMKFIINDNLPEQQNIHYCLDRDSRNKMIIKKDGYTILSPLEMTGDFYINQGLMMMKPFVDPANDISMELYVLYDRKHNQASYKEDFLDLVKKYFKNLDYPLATNV